MKSFNQTEIVEAGFPDFYAVGTTKLDEQGNVVLDTRYKLEKPIALPYLHIGQVVYMDMVRQGDKGVVRVLGKPVLGIQFTDENSREVESTVYKEGPLGKFLSQVDLEGGKVSFLAYLNYGVVKDRENYLFGHIPVGYMQTIRSIFLPLLTEEYKNVRGKVLRSALDGNLDQDSVIKQVEILKDIVEKNRFAIAKELVSKIVASSKTEEREFMKRSIHLAYPYKEHQKYVIGYLPVDDGYTRVIPKSPFHKFLNEELIPYLRGSIEQINVSLSQYPFLKKSLEKVDEYKNQVEEYKKEEIAAYRFLKKEGFDMKVVEELTKSFSGIECTYFRLMDQAISGGQVPATTEEVQDEQTQEDFPDIGF